MSASIYIANDVEADGPAPGLHSMVALGAVVIESGLARSFTARLRPLTDRWEDAALKVCGFTRAETLEFPRPEAAIRGYAEWLESLGSGRLVFVSDNPGFDWGYMNHYLHRFLGRNPYGHQSEHLGSLYRGFVRGERRSFRHLVQTPHTHDPLDDARGVAEAFLALEAQGLQRAL